MMFSSLFKSVDKCLAEIDSLRSQLAEVTEKMHSQKCMRIDAEDKLTQCRLYNTRLETELRIAREELRIEREVQRRMLRMEEVR